MFQVMILLIDCLLPAVTFTGHHLILQFIARSENVYLPNDISPYNLRNTRRLRGTPSVPEYLVRITSLIRFVENTCNIYISK
jgi:hypothetical protein